MYNPVLRVHLIDPHGFDDAKRKDGEMLRDIIGWVSVINKQEIQLSGLEDTGASIKFNENLIEADRKHKAESAALKEDMKEADEASKREMAELIRKQQADIEENARQRKKLETNMAKLEADRARDLEELEAKLADQASNLQRKENDIKGFQASMKRREDVETLDKAEKSRLHQEPLDMEKERATKLRQWKADVEQAKRKGLGFWATIGEAISEIFEDIFG
ncbi:hypothetical protein V8E51_013060 [Hyaloscypha variabilis]